MLNIWFGDMPDVIYNTSVFFKNTYNPRWIIDPLAVEMIADVDRSRVVSEQLIESPVLGMITPVQLSGGVKTLILIANDKSGKHVFNASNCGDNCAKWLLKIAEHRKVLINLRHLMVFEPEPFKISIVNSGKIVHNMREYVLEAGTYV